MKFRYLIITLLTLFQFSGIISAQNQDKIDSLQNIIKESRNDTTRIITFLNLGDIYEYIIPDTAIYFYNKALKLSKEIKTQKHIAKSLSYIGNVKYSQGNYNIAIDFYLKALKIYEEIGYNRGMSSCYNNIGNIHYYQRSYNKAIEYYLKSLKIFEEIDDKKEMSGSYNNIGGVYRNQGNSEMAIEYYLKSLEIREELGDKKGMSGSYNNIGIIHIEQGKYDKAIEYYLKSLKIFVELSDKSGIAEVYINLADLNIALADSTALSERQGTNYLNKAVEYATEAYGLAIEINALPIQNDAAAHLLKAYTKLSKYKEAIKYAEIIIMTQDNMFNEDKVNALAEMSAKYESEKNQLELEKSQKQNELDNKTIEAQQSENRKQLIIIIAAIVGFFIVLVFSIIFLRMFRQKKKANILLSEQKAVIEDKNRDILDSINYAKRIQTALLTEDIEWLKVSKEYMALLKPKNVVSGDFFWAFHNQEENLSVWVAADCTGHGVPGAFMSMLGIGFLNEIIVESGVTKSSEILNKLREKNNLCIRTKEY